MIATIAVALGGLALGWALGWARGYQAGKVYGAAYIQREMDAGRPVEVKS